ncbi:DUF2079 domain-containing protein [Candidatus Sumerlaeota bacterium]|nr:DUF2079 domain-containing protein [Candidatus Sumerlaeota bacterium]
MVLVRKEEKDAYFHGKRRSPWFNAICVCSILYLLFLVTVNFLRYKKGYNFHDLFIFENSFWNTLHGHIFWNFYEFGNHLGVHFSPGLFLLVPFYALFPKPHTLLFLQSLAIALAGIPLFLLSLRILKDEASSFLVTLCYWCYAPTLGAAFSGFHETPFVLPFLFATFLALESGNKRLFWVFVIFSLVWRETFSLMFLFWGISLLFRSQMRKTGRHLVLVSFAWMIWSFFIIMPLLRGAPVSSSMIQYRFPKEIGHSFPEIIQNFFRNPGFFLGFALQKEKVFYLLQLVIPLLFLPLFQPLTLIPILPQLGENLLSSRLFGASLLKHYTVPMIPFIYYALLKAVPRLTGLFEKRGIYGKRSIRLVTAIIFLLCLFMIFPSEVYVYVLKGERNKDEALHYVTPLELEAAKNMEGLAPRDASLAVSGHLAKYFARRKVICYLSPGFMRVFPFDYLLYYAPSPDLNVFRTHRDLSLLLEKKYELVDRKGRLYLFKRRTLEYPVEEQKIMKAIPQ